MFSQSRTGRVYLSVQAECSMQGRSSGNIVPDKPTYDGLRANGITRGDESAPCFAYMVCSPLALPATHVCSSCTNFTAGSIGLESRKSSMDFSRRPHLDRPESASTSNGSFVGAQADPAPSPEVRSICSYDEVLTVEKEGRSWVASAWYESGTVPAHQGMLWNQASRTRDASRPNM